MCFRQNRQNFFNPQTNSIIFLQGNLNQSLLWFHTEFEIADMQEKKGHYKLNHNIAGGSLSMHMYFCSMIYSGHIIRKALFNKSSGKTATTVQASTAQFEQTINKT